MTEAPHNLPAQPTPLVGREREVQAACMLLERADVRLLTLTGPGGIGKTRVGMQVATELLEAFGDGVFLAELAPIRDPAHVVPTICRTLKVRDRADRSASESLAAHLQDGRVLILLDNFEHVLPAAPEVADLLAACPGLKVLVTSRAVLHLRGEREFPVPPLALPEPGLPSRGEMVLEYAAVALFVQRASDVRPDFRLDDEQAGAVAEICRRLDGLPLAIELAAARVKLLTPRAMVSRLERRLPLLTGGARDLPARQRTLRDTIAWSYDLLGDAERRLFQRLAVFVGGFGLEAAEAVGAESDGTSWMADPSHDIDILDAVSSLVDKSLLRLQDSPDDEPRFTMLETIREYGLEQLEASGEADAIRYRHASHFLAQAEEGASSLFGPDQVTWMRRLDLDQANFRAIMGWSRNGRVPAEVGLRLVGALDAYWLKRGSMGESRVGLDALLAVPGAAARTVGRARALWAAAVLANRQADHETGRSLAEESAEICRETHDLPGVGRALLQQARAQEGLGNRPVARSLLDESVALARQFGNPRDLALALGNLGAWVQSEGDYGAAASLRAESAAIAREHGDLESLGTALAGLASLARLRGSSDESVALWKEALVISSEIGDRWVTLRALAGLAGASCLVGDHRRSARLFGAVKALREAHGTRETALWRAINDGDVAAARAGLGDDAFAVEWAAGRSTSLPQAIDLALSTDPSVPPAATSADRPPDAPADQQPSPLSPREAEVAALIARGLTNRDIGDRLVITERTVDAHVRHILDKLGVAARAQIAVWAVRQGLVAD